MICNKNIDVRYKYCHKHSCPEYSKCYGIFSEVRRKHEEENEKVLNFKIGARNISMKLKPESPLYNSHIFQNNIS